MSCHSTLLASQTQLEAALHAFSRPSYRFADADDPEVQQH